ncbi:MAG: phosphotransferase family protein [Pirellulaceae bacterium]|nr:phosphotransferase family protein [Pirellulaceae bacterium]
MIDRAGPIRSGEELDLRRLTDYLSAELPGGRGEWQVEQFPRGYSNLTYLLRNGDQEFVLRRPPFGNAVQSAHDMGREFRVLKKLCEVYPAAPRPLLYCASHDVIGAEFYIMERRSGVVLRSDNTPAELKNDPAKVRTLCESFIDNLATLHTLDYRAAGLGDLGRPQGYVERQVTGWMKRYQTAQTDTQPELDQLEKWLAEHCPADGQPALIHNDYKYDNLILDSRDLTRIVAVLDWEMATVGDPFMDLGMSLAYWIEPDDSVSMRALAFGPTMLRGSLTRQQLYERYCQQTGRQTSQIMFYYSFGLYKLAVIVQQIYARYVCGLTADPRFAGMNDRVAALGRAGSQAIAKGTLD